MKRILIVGANPYNDNKGVAALCESTIIFLHKVIKDLNVDIEIAVYNHEFRRSKDTICFNNRSIEFVNVYPTPHFNINNFFKIITSKWRLYNLKEFLKSDYIVNVAAGDSFSDIYGADHFYSVDAPNRLARFFHKPYLMLPQTLGPFDLKGIFWPMAKRSLEKASLVIARDKQSFDFVKENTKQQKAFESLDMAFFLPYQPFFLDKKMVNVGLNISALLWNGGYTYDNQFCLKLNYRSLIHNIICYFLEKTDCILHLVPHVVSSSNNVENDYQVSYDLLREYHHKRLVLSPFFLNPIEAKGYIASLDFFMGARMHACIAAYSSNVPVVPMSYSRKFNGLFEDTLSYHFVLDMINLDENMALDMCIKAFQERNLLVDFIKQTNVTFVEKKKEELYNLLKPIFLSI